MLNDIIFQVIIASFGVTIVNSDKIKFLQKFRYAIYVLILSFLLYKGVPWKRENYYTYLNITPNATKQEIQTAYRQAAKIYHPDKNPDESADSAFIKLKQAYDVLTDDTRRSNYNRFGDYKNGEVDDNTATLLICLSLVQHTMFFIIGYFLSYPRKLVFARQIFLVYNIASFCFELQFRFIEDDTTFDWLPSIGYLLPYEKIKLLRMLFPIVFFISICAAAYTYTDRNATLIYLMRSILATNRIVFERSNDVVDSTNYLKKNGEQLVSKLQEMRKAVEDAKYAQAKLKDKEQKDKSECLEDSKKDPKDENNADDKLRENVQEFALTLDSHQMGLLEKCFEMMKNKNTKDKKNQKKSWFEFISMQMIFGIIFVYIWFTSK
ncbi:DNAJ-like molecular chaperone protein, putative [Plasmodium knowlesi strain H]|uniref:DNAJ-like molecular chaperone protein, putative n=3 Tax=Plasmodium knowlesi TaxID=5850 RepID=A0A5K1VHM2_PLAKH|nr:DnaJ protein, putative [Plasmodium knowlesi strain H]OTN67350.1 putative DNAJ-like molecular chaperone protein [Plasmodium knowlesi]CAA9987461.1 DnaJ protein, putative [Plasmodium knowlesi strain H]SBO23226.1 DNAJ-like molecular chaperone protein, putative [Plasmodium knowlesi strain H]SBO24068.1 DNAJ-like molecular chaperone protein, putative [Plasmodium knowlesi strain H]VVS76935.1 DnaJ protein, putative [Plasmodium knowlesi strain H]|eukprot:XP_002258462.1 dnaj-like molecular chaperone protein, putative [Plasmodium knowlesi strain H]